MLNKIGKPGNFEEVHFFPVSASDALISKYWACLQNVFSLSFKPKIVGTDFLVTAHS